MKPLVFFSFLFFTLLSIPALAQEQQIVVPYTLTDRDRAILTEAKLGSLEAKLNALEAKMELNLTVSKDNLTTSKHFSTGGLAS